MRLFVNGKKVISHKIGNTSPYLYDLRLGEADVGMRLSDVRVYKGNLSKEKRLELMVDRHWFRTRAEALLSAGRAGEAEDMVEKWSEITERLVPPQPVRRSATIRRIESLVQRGSDQALLTAQELINDLLNKAPRRLLSGEFNITMLDMYLGRGANLVALNHAERLLNLQLASTHEEKIMGRRVVALTRLGKLEKARNAFNRLKKEYPYGGSLRMAREELEKHEGKKQ